MDQTELEKVARKRVKMKREYVTHVLFYALVQLMLYVVWHLTGRGYPWFVWPLVGWGVGIVAHTITVAMELIAPEERAVERELRRLHH